VYVSGNDVYVAEYAKNHSNIDVATVWKNGIAETLDDDGWLFSVFVK
jgi:hypothetical protein